MACIPEAVQTLSPQALNPVFCLQGIKDGFQVELPDIWLQNGNPWELKRPGIVYPIGFYGSVKDGVWSPAEKVKP